MPTVKIEDLKPQIRCNSPEHNPPSMMHWEPGVYEHTCPICGKKQTFRVEPPIY